MARTLAGFSDWLVMVCLTPAGASSKSPGPNQYGSLNALLRQLTSDGAADHAYWALGRGTIKGMCVYV